MWHVYPRNTLLGSCAARRGATTLTEPAGAAYPAPEALPTSAFLLLVAGGGALLLRRSPERGELHRRRRCWVKNLAEQRLSDCQAWCGRGERALRSTHLDSGRICGKRCCCCCSGLLMLPWCTARRPRRHFCIMELARAPSTLPAIARRT